jgi:hypothetical protein
MTGDPAVPPHFLVASSERTGELLVPVSKGPGRYLLLVEPQHVTHWTVELEEIPGE